jgi:hypothetical protein
MWDLLAVIGGVAMFIISHFRDPVLDCLTGALFAIGGGLDLHYLATHKNEAS